MTPTGIYADRNKSYCGSLKRSIELLTKGVWNATHMKLLCLSSGNVKTYFSGEWLSCQPLPAWRSPTAGSELLQACEVFFPVTEGILLKTCAKFNLVAVNAIHCVYTCPDIFRGKVVLLSTSKELSAWFCNGDYHCLMTRQSSRPQSYKLTAKMFWCGAVKQYLPKEQ